ncbi:MAG: Ferredoxin reductase, partial [uncultured Friedmanniella sp.]
GGPLSGGARRCGRHRHGSRPRRLRALLRRRGRSLGRDAGPVARAPRGPPRASSGRQGPPAPARHPAGAGGRRPSSAPRGRPRRRRPLGRPPDRQPAGLRPAAGPGLRDARGAPRPRRRVRRDGAGDRTAARRGRAGAGRRPGHRPPLRSGRL